MFYLYHVEHSEIIANVDDKKMVYKMINRQLMKKVKHPITQVLNWYDVEKEGFYFRKLDNDIEFREFIKDEGYIYNSLYYNIVGNFKILEYDIFNETKEDFVDEIKKGIVCKNIICKDIV